MNWRLWLKGLAAAAIGGAANAITASSFAPESFNLGAQWKKTLGFTIFSAIFAAAGYLKQSPIPETKIEGNTNETTK